MVKRSISSYENTEILELLKSKNSPEPPPDPKLYNSEYKSNTMVLSFPDSSTPIPTVGEMSNYIIDKLNNGYKQ